MTAMINYTVFTRRMFTGTAMLTDQFVTVTGTKIIAVGNHPPDGMPILRLADDVVLSPGFVDLQVNGGGGILFNDAMNAAGLARIVTAHRRAGTTSILPTVISGSRDLLRTAMELVTAACHEPSTGIVGLHLEGPFLAPERRGIHPTGSITTLCCSDIDLLCTDFPGKLLVTLAPELAPAGAIARLTAAGRIVFAGHTAASFEQIGKALAEGLAGFTHLFNAMSQITAREPGAVGAALANRRAYAGIILDGLHVHPATAQIALAAMGPERLFLVSDAMPTVGAEATEFTLDGKQIRLTAGKLTDAAGTLAGAHLTLADAVRNAVRLLGCELEDALRMATSTPAACLCLGDRIGHIGPGHTADMVALDAELRPIEVWASGRAIRPA